MSEKTKQYDCKPFSNPTLQQVPTRDEKSCVAMAKVRKIAAWPSIRPLQHHAVGLRAFAHLSQVKIPTWQGINTGSRWR